jgi:hypothetical protein
MSPTVVENDLRTLFRLEADAEQPLARISIPAASRRARIRQRRRRALTFASPVLAGLAVVAVALASTAAPNLAHGTAAGNHPAGGSAAPQYFSPLRPYVWLPDGRSAKTTGAFSPTDELLYVGPLDEVHIWAASGCREEKGLGCNGQASSMGRYAGQVHGHPAFWEQARPVRGVQPLLGGTLNWVYARNGLAQVYASDERVALRTARSLIVGPTAGPPIRFAAQMIRVAASWRVANVTTQWVSGVEYAADYYLTANPRNLKASATGLPQIGASLALARQSDCKDYMPQYKHRTETINGYRAYVGVNPNPRGWPESALCAADADGQMVSLEMDRHPAISAVDFFAHHLRLLGPDPAKWTTRPIG